MQWRALAVAAGDPPVRFEPGGTFKFGEGGNMYYLGPRRDAVWGYRRPGGDWFAVVVHPWTRIGGPAQTIETIAPEVQWSGSDLVALAPDSGTVWLHEWETVALDVSSLPGGRVGEPYNASLRAHGGIGPHVFQSVSPLPEGLILRLDGSLSGVPRQAGTHRLTVLTMDQTGGTGEGLISMEVAEAHEQPPLPHSEAAITLTMGFAFPFTGIDLERSAGWVLTGPRGRRHTLSLGSQSGLSGFLQTFRSPEPPASNERWTYSCSAYLSWYDSYANENREGIIDNRLPGIGGMTSGDYPFPFTWLPGWPVPIRVSAGHRLATSDDSAPRVGWVA